MEFEPTIKKHSSFYNHDFDIRDRAALVQLMRIMQPAAVVHTAAQPGHNLAAMRPFDDFDINAVGTVNLLGASYLASPEAPFVHLSTNKVYGDSPNNIPLIELQTHWEYADPAFASGIHESCRIYQSKNSLFEGF